MKTRVVRKKKLQKGLWVIHEVPFTVRYLYARGKHWYPYLEGWCVFMSIAEAVEWYRQHKPER